MKTIYNWIFSAVFTLVATAAFSQGTVTGTIMDGEFNEPLPGANVMVKGTTNGTSTDFNGKFSVDVSENSGTLVITYVGFIKKEVKFTLTGGSANLGTIVLKADAQELEGVVVVGSGVIDLASDRKTPVAVSTIKASEIREKAANWDLPEILKSTPSVQNIKGGGFGDGSMFLRGFDQTNTAFLLNGQPINGMEDGKMYWSNWSGVLDVANAVQVQRGLGASKLAISSVGGTVNIVTKTIDQREGGFAQALVGNNNYVKTTAYYSTGVNEKGWSFSAMLGHWQGNGYVDHTDGQGQTYFISVGYQPNENNTLNFLITGAPQWHAVAGSGSIESFLENGRRYNSWNFSGVNSPNTLNGKGNVYPGGRNIYHKPVANLSWDWTINEKSGLSTVLYGSMGRGSFAQAITSGNDVLYARGSNNNHNWYGIVTNYNNQLTENLNFNIGADARFYNGIHFRDVREFISVDAVNASSGYSGDYVLTSAGGINPWKAFFNPNNDHGQKFGYDYEEQINYTGVFGQLEYANDALSAFFQGSLSTQSHVRTEFLNTQQEGKSEESDKIHNPGFNVKAGIAYALAQNHKVFANAGHYSRQPFHDVLFRDNRGSNEYLMPEVENEKITGFEAGYKLGGSAFSANLNLYHTTWDNRTLLSDNGEQEEDYIGYQTQGVKQVHTGVELEVFTRPFDKLKLNGFMSVGNWKFKGNGSQRSFDQDGDEIGSAVTVEIDGFNVGGAAQFTAGINADYEILPRFSVDGAWNLYNNFYSTGSLTEETLELPSYDTVDAGLSYKMLVGQNKQNSVQLRFNLNNVFDEVYLESVNGNLAASNNPDENYKGVNINNNGRFGYGRTWNFSLRYNF
ncbi:TonB-dependent receptor [Zhouia spongiae]|uniref:TonB-dependent receptor n=1 Tax=Zhouia spongiae TaxID=2202721 RepID=A0ABY3YNC5_9FLAO|nr:TonB-dependent receptor [Zhouia spongiae]UNY99330.1 TonB-dependent receptor [Zhouia spongiae]